MPFGPFIPNRQAGWGASSAEITDQHSLFKNIRFNNAKRELLRELELLVIDEVSMVRADMLDAIDAILRHFRRQPLLPFGGVQVLYIGDLFPVAPVVGNEEWDGILKHHYASPFFFDAHVIKQAPPVYLELKRSIVRTRHLLSRSSIICATIPRQKRICGNCTITIILGSFRMRMIIILPSPPTITKPIRSTNINWTGWRGKYLSSGEKLRVISMKRPCPPK
ncbi:hypothetical protein [Paraflavitalea speifideaquila]|uniref:hypothetical protein n=1 Tax=Paraflavitalea speifideaquila TaxID=3076558 RepID=UPI0028E22723|nr:hypothetical protein [Paraflavitalea speifideiaquila]